MSRPPVFKKNLFAYRDDPWVEVLVPGLEGVSETDAFAFRASTIKGVKSFGPDHALIQCEDGKEYMFTLSYQALMQALDMPEGGRVNLTGFSVAGGKEPVIKKLREAFRRAQEQKEEKDIAAVTIKAFIRTAHKSEFVPFEFAGKDVQLSKIEQGGSIHGGQRISFKLYEPQQTPFGGQEFNIECTLDDFRRICREAVARNEKHVDISDLSMRKFKGATPEQRRRENEQKKSP